MTILESSVLLAISYCLVFGFGYVIGSIDIQVKDKKEGK